MKKIGIFLLFLVTHAAADDLSFCRDQCARQFAGKDKEQMACSTSCVHRGTINDGARGFLACHEACGIQHNETDSEGAASPERQACDWACSLPITNVVMMKVDYGSGDGAPRVQVMRKEGGDMFGPQLGLGPDFDQLILRPSDINGGLLTPGAHKEEAAEAEARAAKEGNMVGWGVPGGILSNMFKIRTGDAEMDRMQDRMEQMVQSFFNRAQLATRIASARPSGHESLSFMGPSVGNEDSDGHQLLFVAPMEGDDWVDLHEFERPHDSALRRRFPALFQWTVCLILLIAILCTLIVALLMMRQMRLHRYRALRGQMTSTASGGAPSAEAPPIVKKIPIDVEEPSLPEPTGVPPPAYDQLSVHAKRSSLQ